MLREIRILQRLKHPNIINLFEVINDEDDNYIYLVMEYLSGGSILSKQQSSICLDESVARSYFVDVSCGLEYRTDRSLCNELNALQPDQIMHRNS